MSSLVAGTSRALPPFAGDFEPPALAAVGAAAAEETPMVAAQISETRSPPT
jgi:hypothetical protein